MEITGVIIFTIISIFSLVKMIYVSDSANNERFNTIEELYSELRLRYINNVNNLYDTVDSLNNENKKVQKMLKGIKSENTLLKKLFLIQGSNKNKINVSNNQVDNLAETSTASDLFRFMEMDHEVNLDEIIETKVVTKKSSNRKK